VKVTLPAVDGSGLACLGVSGYVIGLSLPFLPELDVPLVFLVACAVLAALTSPGHPRLTRSLVALPVLGFVAARLVSALAAEETLRSLRIAAPILPALLLFFVLSEWVRTGHHVVVICVSLTVAGLLLATTFLVRGWLSPGANPDEWAVSAWSPLLVVKNDMTVVAVLAPLALAAAAVRPRWVVRLLVLGFFVALAAAIGAMQSRTVLITAVVAVACFGVFTRGSALVERPRRAWLLAGGAILLVLLVDAMLGFRFAHKVLSDWQGHGRLALWVAALAMFQDAPVLGHGPHSFVLQYRGYLDAMPLPGWVFVDPRLTPWPHNLILELLSEQGIVGLAAFLVLVGAGITMVVRLLRTRPSDLRQLGAGVGAALVAFLTAAMVELTMLRAWVTIVLFTLFGLLATITRVEHEGRAC
jgi:O-antigen ligase